MKNLTPHSITIFFEDGTQVVLSSSGSIRLEETEKEDAGAVEVGDTKVPTVRPPAYGPPKADEAESKDSEGVIVSALVAPELVKTCSVPACEGRTASAIQADGSWEPKPWSAGAELN